MDINVESEQKDPNSILNYYKKLLALRKSDEYKEVFVYGQYDSVLEDLEGVYIYTRYTDNKKVCVVTNMLENKNQVTIPFDIKKVLLANYNKEYSSNTLKLDPFETIVFEI